MQNVYFSGQISSIGSNPNSGGIAGNAGSLAHITNSLMIGLIPTSSTANQGGLRRNCGGTCNDHSYWATDLTSQGTSATGGAGGEQTKSAIQTPTSAAGLYSAWDATIWDFGTSTQYPALLGLPISVANQRSSYQTH